MFYNDHGLIKLTVQCICLKPNVRLYNHVQSLWDNLKSINIDFSACSMMQSRPLMPHVYMVDLFMRTHCNTTWIKTGFQE